MVVIRIWISFQNLTIYFILLDAFLGYEGKRKWILSGILFYSKFQDILGISPSNVLLFPFSFDSVNYYPGTISSSDFSLLILFNVLNQIVILDQGLNPSAIIRFVFNQVFEVSNWLRILVSTENSIFPFCLLLAGIRNCFMRL